MINSSQPTIRMLRQFSAVWILFFGLSAAWHELAHQRHTLAAILAFLAISLGPLGLCWPSVMRPVFVTSMTIASPIGWVVSRLVLGLVFYGVLTPIAYLLRLTGRDELALRPHPRSDTYWRPNPSVKDNSQYLRQF